MIKSLDPSKTLLYESDLEKLRPVLQNVITSMQAGDCASLQQVYDVLVARARENEAIVKKILGPDYRLDETVELNINVDKRPYVKTTAEKYELLRKFVQFQIENALLAGVDLAEAKKQQIHHYELQTMRIVERNPEKLITSVAEAFALALDPHTNYLSPENLEDFQIQMQLSLEGIGAVLSSNNGFTVIEELIPGGGAERSGLLKLKDKIIAVAQEGEKPVNVIDMDLHRHYQDDPRQERHAGNPDDPAAGGTHRPLRCHDHARQDRHQGTGGQDRLRDTDGGRQAVPLRRDRSSFLLWRRERK